MLSCGAEAPTGLLNSTGDRHFVSQMLFDNHSDSSHSSPETHGELRSAQEEAGYVDSRSGMNHTRLCEPPNGPLGGSVNLTQPSMSREERSSEGLSGLGWLVGCF